VIGYDLRLHDVNLRVWTVTHLWTHRTRPQALAKPHRTRTRLRTPSTTLHRFCLREEQLRRTQDTGPRRERLTDGAAASINPRVATLPDTLPDPRSLLRDVRTARRHLSRKRERRATHHSQIALCRTGIAARMEAYQRRSSVASPISVPTLDFRIVRAPIRAAGRRFYDNCTFSPSGSTT
jgi:hypothetical protein